ncbi:MAG: hypothetical protein KDC52_14590 [Ignavibacteriae bacterium]|nr:hypothetical protein [Ignavibacteriota bacterium]MCB0752696.1 hypothetical protein [Ignavibacteriota bacterium]MCB9248954.1 hypothetical protein [Ignavibacteriales bacterium]
MKKILLPLFLIVFSIQVHAQAFDGLSELPEQEMKGYSTPLATWTGTYLNSGGYYSASVPKLFSFKISLVGMMIFIPDDQRTFKLDDGTESATFFGDKGAAVPGSQGYAVYPPGVNQTKVPFGIPQISAGTLGSEVMVRFVPTLAFDDVEVGMLGVGIKHSISQYFPLMPLDIAVQIMYNKLSITAPDLDLSTTNLAFNAHASKSFGLVSVYGGLQYESTAMDMEYTFTGSGFGDLDQNKLKLNLDGDNNVRLTLGAALKLAFFVLNADVNIGSQTAIVAGLNFEL